MFKTFKHILTIHVSKDLVAFGIFSNYHTVSLINLSIKSYLNHKRRNHEIENE